MYHEKVTIQGDILPFFFLTPPGDLVLARKRQRKQSDHERGEMFRNGAVSGPLSP
jgi:hypothetical protein